MSSKIVGLIACWLVVACFVVATIVVAVYYYPQDFPAYSSGICSVQCLEFEVNACGCNRRREADVAVSDSAVIMAAGSGARSAGSSNSGGCATTYCYTITYKLHLEGSPYANNYTNTYQRGSEPYICLGNNQILEQVRNETACYYGIGQSPPSLSVDQPQDSVSGLLLLIFFCIATAGFLIGAVIWLVCCRPSCD